MAHHHGHVHKKVLLVLSSHDTLGHTGQKTGWYLPEAAHPWKVFVDNHIDTEFASPKGGEAPLDPNSKDEHDAINNEFLASPHGFVKTKHTMPLTTAAKEKWDGVFLVGGHGTVWDFTDNVALHGIIESTWQHGGIVSAVCHGPCGLLNAKLKTGEYLVAGRKVNGFTNAEEVAAQKDTIVPFMLETELRNRGAIFESSGLWQPHVAVDGRLVTGQNPASATGVAQKVVELLNKK